MGSLVLYLAMSPDGFIADARGGIDWLHGQDECQESEGSYPEFIKGIDTVLMGWNTYRQIMSELSPGQWPYDSLETYVFTHRDGVPVNGSVHLIDEDSAALVTRLKRRQGKGIWVCGGASLARQLMESGLIDRIWLSVIPVLLDEGVRLFPDEQRRTQLQLVDTFSYNGIVDLVYDVR